MFNYNAAIFTQLDRLGIGVTVRDHDARFVVACSDPVLGVLEPEMDKALALRRAVHLALEKHVADVVFATYCLSLVHITILKPLVVLL